MSRWDIRPLDVQGVLQQTEGVARGLDDHVHAINAAIDVSSIQASSEIIAQALTEFVDSQRHDIEFLFTRIGAATFGAGKAVQTYVQGDMEMVQNAYQSAAGLPDPYGSKPEAER